MKTSIFIATSLEGFIAREDGGLDWLPGADGGAGGEDYGYGEFIETVDLIVMGRFTFEKVLTFDIWPYQVPVVVLGSRPVKIPASLSHNVEWMSLPPDELVDALAQRGAKHLYVDGGVTVQRFLRTGLIQRLIITRIPVLIGSGRPLFGLLQSDIELRHIETRSFPSGFVQSVYEIDP